MNFIQYYSFERKQFFPIEISDKTTASYRSLHCQKGNTLFCIEWRLKSNWCSDSLSCIETNNLQTKQTVPSGGYQYAWIDFYACNVCTQPKNRVPQNCVSFVFTKTKQKNRKGSPYETNSHSNCKMWFVTYVLGVSGHFIKKSNEFGDMISILQSLSTGVRLQIELIVYGLPCRMRTSLRLLSVALIYDACRQKKGEKFNAWIKWKI